jgi:capsid protein
MGNPYGGLSLNHFALRQQARDVYHDSTQAHAMVDRFADTTVDSGLTLEPEPDYEMLGITQAQAEDWRSRVRSSFHLWAMSKLQHRSKQYNFYQAQHLYAIESERDNDQFTRLYYNSSSDLLNPLQFELLDANQIRGDAITATNIIGKFPDGITRNPDGSEKSYDIWVQDGDYQFETVTIPRIGEKSKRVFMLHGFVPAYAGQGRGYAGIGEIVQEFELIADFALSHEKLAVNQSQMVMYVKPSDKNPASNPFESLGQTPMGPSVIQAGAPGSMSGVAVNGVTSSPLGAGVAFTPIEESVLKTPGSMVVANLAEGESLDTLRSTAPSPQFEAFLDGMMSYVCASRGMPLEVLKMAFNNNYSASRAALLLFWRVVQMRREHIAADLLDPIYEMWLSEEIAAGRVTCPGWQDPRLRRAWLACRWNGTPMPNIDPSKSAQADLLYAKMGAQTFDDIARNFNGSSGKANRAKMATELKELEASGINPFNSTGAIDQADDESSEPVRPKSSDKKQTKQGAQE